MTETPPRVAREVRITPGAVLIDGDEFPFAMTDDPIRVTTIIDGLSVVTLNVYTDHVHVGAGIDATITTEYALRPKSISD